MKRKITAILGMIVAVSLLGVTVASASHRFTDVPDSNIFHDDIGWMYDNGITLGYEDGTYGPDANVTRGQLAAFMRRLFDRVSEDIPSDTSYTYYISRDPKVYFDELSAPILINIGNSINTNNTNLNVGFDLPAGTYEVTVEGEFIIPLAPDTTIAQCGAGVAVPDGVDIWPQLSLWIDVNANGTFEWQAGEGDISPNAQMPDCTDRHISVSGTTILTLTTGTYVGLLGHGYAAPAGVYNGIITARNARLIATPVELIP